MWIFQHKELTAAFILSLFLFVPYYFLSRKYCTALSSRRAVVALSVLWMTALTAEYFIFGPYSFAASDTDSRTISFLYYLARIHPGGQFVHEIAGGQDLTLIFPGSQFISPERWLLRFLDIWVVLFLHKLFIGVLGFAGAYLLARGMAPDTTRHAAFGAAAVFTVSHKYLLDYSVEFGTGFAVIPLAVYASVVCVRSKRFAVWVLVAGVLLALAMPMKVFPAAAIAIIGGLILYDKRHMGKTAGAFLVFAILSIINWHEVVFGMVTLVDLTTRGFDAEGDVSGVFQSMKGLLFGIYIRHLFVIALFVIAIILLFVRGDRLAAQGLGVIAWFSLAFVFVNSFPGQSIGMAFLNRMESTYMWMAMPVLVVPLVAQAAAFFSGSPTGNAGRGRRWHADAALLAAALSLLTWNKLLNAAWFVALGGQGSLFTFAELKKPDWKTERNVRAITLIDVPPPGITAYYYGIDSFDGAILLNPKPWNDYWVSIKNLPQRNKRIGTRPGLDWRHWDGKAYAAAEALRFDLLRIANVKYLISPLPLTGEGLTPVVSSIRSDWAKVRPGFFPGQTEYFKFRFGRIFEPGRLYIYALSGILPRVFAATGVEIVPDGTGAAALHERVAQSALAKRVVVLERHALGLKGLGRLEVVSFDRVADGYDVTVSAEQGGILVVNNTYLPYWKASSEGQSLKIVPVNGIHMAVAVPAGSRKIIFRYRRPMLRERLGTVFGG